MDVADFFGIATGNKMADKFERTGYHAIKSEFVNAPVIEEFPVVMECELAEVSSTESFYAIVGKIVNTAAEERVLSENRKVEPREAERADLRPVPARLLCVRRKGRPGMEGRRGADEKVRLHKHSGCRIDSGQSFLHQNATTGVHAVSLFASASVL